MCLRTLFNPEITTYVIFDKGNKNCRELYGNLFVQIIESNSSREEVT